MATTVFSKWHILSPHCEYLVCVCARARACVRIFLWTVCNHKIETIPIDGQGKCATMKVSERGKHTENFNIPTVKMYNIVEEDEVQRKNDDNAICCNICVLFIHHILTLDLLPLSVWRKKQNTKRYVCFCYFSLIPFRFCCALVFCAHFLAWDDTQSWHTRAHQCTNDT